MAVGRPVTRVRRVDPVVLEAMLETFGGATQAWRALRLKGLVSYDQFYKLWRGEAMTSGLVEMVDQSWRRFLDRLWEKTKAPVGA